MYDLSCNLSDLTDKVEALVRRSGDIILEHWRHPSHVRHKGRIDLVTETDEAVEAFLVQELQQLVPQAGFLAEEGDAFGPGTDGLCWIIDPVDGTTNFVHRLPHACPCCMNATGPAAAEGPSVTASASPSATPTG